MKTNLIAPYQYEVTQNYCPYNFLAFVILDIIMFFFGKIDIIMFVGKGAQPYVGFVFVTELSALTKLKALDLSGNEFSGSIEFQGKTKSLATPLNLAGELTFIHVYKYFFFCV